MVRAAGWIGKDAVSAVIGNGANKVLSSSTSVRTTLDCTYPTFEVLMDLHVSLLIGFEMFSSHVSIWL